MKTRKRQVSKSCVWISASLGRGGQPGCLIPWIESKRTFCDDDVPAPKHCTTFALIQVLYGPWPKKNPSCQDVIQLGERPMEESKRYLVPAVGSSPYNEVMGCFRQNYP